MAARGGGGPLGPVGPAKGPGKRKFKSHQPLWGCCCGIATNFEDVCALSRAPLSRLASVVARPRQFLSRVLQEGPRLGSPNKAVVSLRHLRTSHAAEADSGPEEDPQAAVAVAGKVLEWARPCLGPRRGEYAEEAQARWGEL